MFNTALWWRNAARAGLCLLALAAVAGAARADVSVALTPAVQSNVPPGSDFDVFVDITAAGSAFNGFDMVVSFDPAAVTLLPAAPTSSQQGCLMTGGCSVACGNTFHVFSTAGDSAVVSDVLLCNATSLNGPGRIYHLRFHAGNTVQQTAINIRSTSFFNAGLFVLPVHKAGCQIGIGVQVGVGPAAPGVARPLRIEPNPSFGRVEFVSDDAAAGIAEADILDLQGRLVRHIGPTSLAAHAALGWDGRGADGARAPAGIYLVKLRRGSLLQSARLVLLP